jgi:hypothetical protein
MKNNMFDPNMLKNLENMMKGFGNITSKPLFDTKLIKKLIIVVGLSVFLSGFGLGLLVGLIF